MSAGYSYSTYTNWDLWVPIGVSILTILLTISTTITAILWFKYHRSTAHHCLELAYHFSHLVLGDALHRDIQSRPPRLTLYDRDVSPVIMILLSTLSPALLIPAIVSFWASFLVSESFACDPGLDCFARDPSSFSISDNRLPLSNCTDYDNDTATIVCFQFVFDYVSGFAAIGGLLVVSVTSLRIYGIVLTWLVGILPHSTDSGRRGNSCVCSIPCSVIGIFLFFLTPIIIAIIIILTVLLVPFINSIVFQSDERILKFASYWSCLLYTGTMTGVCILATVLHNKTRSDDYNTREHEDREAEITSSFVLSAPNPLGHQENTVKSINTAGATSSVLESQPVPAPKYEEPNFNPPKLMGSMMNSFQDVTSLRPQHSESSLLLSAPAKPSDYQTT